MLIPHTEKLNFAALLLIATLQLAKADQFMKYRRSTPEASNPLPSASITVSASGVSASNNEISPSGVNAFVSEITSVTASSPGSSSSNNDTSPSGVNSFASEITTTTASSSGSSGSDDRTLPSGVNAFASEVSSATASVTAVTEPSSSGSNSNPIALDDYCLDYTEGVTILPIVSSLRDLAQAPSTLSSQTDSSSNCTAPNGGCERFIKSLDSCQDDNCVCELSYSAQLCAQCLSSESAVHEYNLYLTACAQRGLIKPTETVTAECEDAIQTSDVLTDMLASQLATKTASATSTSGSTKSVDSMGEVAVQMPDGSQITDPAMISNSAKHISTMTTTNANGQATSVLTFVGPTAGAVSSGSSISDSVSSATDQVPATAALDSAHTFFSETVDPTCEKDCESWRDLAQTCTSDNRICTPDAMDSAKSCSSCVLSASSIQQMAAYAGFTQGCISASSAPVDADGDTITTDVQGNAAFAIPPSFTSKSDNSNPFEQDTQEAQSKGAVKTRVAEQAKGMATTVEVEPSAGAACGRAGQLLGIGGMGWVVTGIVGGLLIVHI